MFADNTYLENARKAILESSDTSSVYIGCDSQRKYNGKDRGWNAVYAVAIIIHRDSKHGCQIFGTKETMRDFGNLRQRLMNEVMYAVNASMEIIDVIGERNFEIHLDINTDNNYKSAIAVKEALGYVRGTLGVEPKLKPDSFASTHCADMICNGKWDRG